MSIIDGDPERCISQWGDLSERQEKIRVINNIAEDGIVDLEGKARLMVENATGMPDLVLIPA